MTPPIEIIRKAAQVILGIALAYAGFKHLTSSRLEFQAQVPSVLQSQADFIVLASGVVEIALGVALMLAWRYRVQVGWVVGLFFVAVFWGNISQYLNGVDAFGLNSDRSRFMRLLFQPLLVMWALWSTGACRAYRGRGK